MKNPENQSYKKVTTGVLPDRDFLRLGLLAVP